MPSNNQQGNYVQGYSKSTLSTHLLRTAESEGSFLLPHIKKQDRILDLGCGPGTITTGFRKYASEGKIIGLDMSDRVLDKARALAAEANIPTDGLGSVTFEQGNVLEGLSYADQTFDIVYCSHVFGHLPMPHEPSRALAEIRRILKPGGILATRDAAASHFYPTHFDLDRLWVHNLQRAVNKGKEDGELTGPSMPALLCQAGFDMEGGKIHVGARAEAHSTREKRRWLAQRAATQLQTGDPFRESWLDAGITEDEIDETVRAAQTWAETEGAWFGTLHCEIIAWR